MQYNQRLVITCQTGLIIRCGAGTGCFLSQHTVYVAIKLLWTLEWTLLANHVINLWVYPLCEICTHWLFWVKIMKLWSLLNHQHQAAKQWWLQALFGQASHSDFVADCCQKQWFTKCFGHRFSLNISALSCTGSIEGSWKRSSRLRAEVWETENEIETEWIRRGVREIRTLPQEAGLNSSSPCMVKTPPKATGSSWEYSQSPAKYKSHSHGNSGTDQSVYERKLVKVVWSAWCHTNTMQRQMLQLGLKFCGRLSNVGRSHVENAQP